MSDVTSKAFELKRDGCSCVEAMEDAAAERTVMKAEMEIMALMLRSMATEFRRLREEVRTLQVEVRSLQVTQQRQHWQQREEAPWRQQQREEAPVKAPPPRPPQ